MGKRRPSGDGMVRKRADGRWEGRIVIGHKDNGDSIFRYLSAHTQKELLNTLHRNLHSCYGVDLREGCKMPLWQWLEHWLTEYIAPTVRESTLKRYRNDLENYVIPTLGDIPVSKVSRTDVQKLYRSLRENGRINEHPIQGNRLSNSTVRSIHSVFHQAMDAAVRERLTVKNPTENVTLPKKESVPKKILNDAQLERFLEVIQGDELWRDFFYTAITTGLRQGELCGLMWQDFDSKRGELSIRRTVHQREGGGLTTGETKTNQGRRVITLPPSTVEMLRERKKRSYSQWIFHNPLVPEQPLSPGRAYTRLKELLREAGLPSLRFHDLRHTFATHALASGVDAKTLSGILGHTKASFTLDTYTHVTGDMQKRASEIVGGFMNDFVIRR